METNKNIKNVVLIGLDNNFKEFGGGQFSLLQFFENKSNVIFLNRFHFKDSRFINYKLHRSRIFNWLSTIFDIINIIKVKPEYIYCIHISGYIRLNRIPNIFIKNIKIVHFLFENDYCLEDSNIIVPKVNKLKWKHYRSNTHFSTCINVYNSIFVRSYYNDNSKSYIYSPYPSNFQISALLKHSDWLKRKKQIIFIGRIIESKAINKIINIAKVVKKYHFLIVGTGPKLNYYTHHSDQLKNLTFTGPINETDKNVLLKSSRFFLSCSNFEGFGMPIWESVFFGTIPLLLNNKPFTTLYPDYKNCLSFNSLINFLSIEYNSSQYNKDLNYFKKYHKTLELYNKELYEKLS